VLGAACLAAVAGCGGGGSSSASTPPPAASRASSSAPAGTGTAAATPSAGATPSGAADNVRMSQVGGPNTIATARGKTIEVYKQPGGPKPAVTLTSPNEDGVKRVFLVVGRTTGWWKVLMPVQPNGTLGWIPADQVTTAVTTFRIQIFRGQHRLRVYDGRRISLDVPAAVGRTSTPGPGTHYYLTALMQPPNPQGQWGPFAYGLSGYATTLKSFSGTQPIVGIHGTNQPALLGKDAPSGSIQISNAAITQLAKVLPLGTPVDFLA
jgi:lipoprotein-anchoring transpeptidase ErfK/SrfK